MDAKLHCQECQQELGRGRSDRKFCDELCRNAYHNKQKIFESKETKRVRLILNKNRRILRTLLKNEREKVIATERLLRLGYDFDYLTHRKLSATYQYEYTYCFDYGYRVVKEGTLKVVKAFAFREDR